MALIEDPDLLNNGTEVLFDTTNRTVQLVEAGNLSADGVNLQALYSFAKEEWIDNASLLQYEFPFVAITEEKYEFVSGWTPADLTTIKLLRNGGFAVKNSDGSSAEEYACVITLGEIGVGNQVYYQQEVDGAPIDFTYTQAVNECIKVFGDIDNGNFDHRDVLKVFIREYGSTYDSSDLIAIGVDELTYQAYRFPLTNTADTRILYSTVAADSYGVTITYYDTPVQREIEGINYNFDVIIDGAGLANERIYEAVQSALQKNVNIDSGIGTVIGKTADELLRFVGDRLITSNGVFIDNFNSAYINDILFFDTSGSQRAFPFIAAGTITFSSSLINDSAGEYRMLYTEDFGTSACITVQDASGAEITGSIDTSTVSFTFDYDGNGNFDKYVTLIANGRESGQYIRIDGLITRTVNNNFVVTSADELNYTFPENQ